MYLGYTTYLVNSVGREKSLDEPLSKNKFSLKDYIELFNEGKKTLQLKARKDKRQQKALATPVTSTATPSASAVCSPRPVVKPTSTVYKPPILIIYSRSSQQGNFYWGGTVPAQCVLCTQQALRGWEPVESRCCCSRREEKTSQNRQSYPWKQMFENDVTIHKNK